MSAGALVAAPDAFMRAATPGDVLGASTADAGTPAARIALAVRASSPSSTSTPPLLPLSAACASALLMRAFAGPWSAVRNASGISQTQCSPTMPPPDTSPRLTMTYPGRRSVGTYRRLTDMRNEGSLQEEAAAIATRTDRPPPGAAPLKGRRPLRGGGKN